MAETIFDALRESHEIQRSLMRRLLRSQPGEARSALFEQLRIELSAHEAAEERFLYVPMLMDDRGLPLPAMRSRIITGWTKSSTSCAAAIRVRAGGSRRSGNCLPNCTII
ncbi:hemerythrin domain-containing protein [Burkholderia multivorans]|nr:hemerythrin domain-containing protein [Burkholderia multivorans]